MDPKPEDLLALAMRLSADERRQLAELLARTAGDQVRETAMPYGVRDSGDASTELPLMTSVTIVLPDDLAKQAQAAGLLGEASLAELIRRALQEKSGSAASVSQSRRLVRENGRLVAEGLPGEQAVTSERIADLLNRMEW